MMTRINFENTRATVISIHFRTHEEVISARDPAKASGANTAVMISSSLRTINASQTMTVAPIMPRATTRRAASDSADNAEAPNSMVPACCQFVVPNPSCMTPLLSRSVATSNASSIDRANAAPTNATTTPRPARPMPLRSCLSADAATWMTSSPRPTIPAMVPVISHGVEPRRAPDLERRRGRDLAPQPTRHVFGGVAEVLGDLVERVPGRLPGNLSDAITPRRGVDRAGHLSSRSRTDTAP